MNCRPLILSLLACAATLTAAGCRNAPGRPGPDPEVARPESILDFPTLYHQNCASCHGEKGTNGAAISLANPVYLALAGVQNIERVTAAGVPGTAMPPFGKSAGGMLTDQQIAAIAQGMEQAWGRPNILAGTTPPAYPSTAPGNPAAGQQAFTTFCAPCHGADATGGKAPNGAQVGSLVDPAYLALITDQGLRSIILAGQPEQGMPDWRSHKGHNMTDQEVTDVVAWLTSHRIATPGQPYRQQP
jgi:cytochrome c oxidase cbb3-type subunit 3/ubiquinol-cytochrome c reductase cytochrome c subunit